MKRLAWTGNIMSIGSNQVSGAIIATATAGENLVFGNVCYYKSDGEYYKANADDTGTISNQLVMALETISANATGRFLVDGYVFSSGFSYTTGAKVYLGTTDGATTESAPTTSLKEIGMGDGTILYFNASQGARDLETELYLASSSIYDGETVTYNNDIVTY